MSRTTVDYGIDLGTTNSSIALLRGTQVEVFKNNEGFDYTPSAVWLDKQSRIVVGRRAKERLDDDPDNAFAEFKLQMGTNEAKIFKRINRKIRPQDLSALVLKALKQDARQRTNEDVRAAAITVPAAFELPQCEATKQAAQAAGFEFSPLLQEPVAAALAYGFQSNSDKVFWLVYDLGGGTFDAAVIHMRDGSFQVVNHGGDNHLGGKLLDWEIVDQLLVPAVLRDRQLADFRRGNPRWIAAFAKLKLAAEEAKIQVSRDDATEIIIDFLCQDERGDAVRFEYELQRADVERIAEPFIVRSINICKRALSEKRLGAADVEKVLLIGGPTLTPYLRERLADRTGGLGIALDTSVDPMTAVARGAAIFAGTQRMPQLEPIRAAAGQFALDLEYKPIGADTEPLVAGKVVTADGASLTGFTIEFVNAGSRPPWRSGQVDVDSAGTFMTSLWAERGKTNQFQIELCDKTGAKQVVVPESITYTIGVADIEPPLIHAVGIALANNGTARFFEKGTALPARKRQVRKTAVAVRRDQAGHLIRIPVIEGENRRADRNRLIGMLEIASGSLKRDVPAGTEVEITIDIDASRLIRTKAYIPFLDEEFESVLKLGKKTPKLDDLRRDCDAETKRLDEVRHRAVDTSEPRLHELLERVDSERMEHDVTSALAAAEGDRDAADKCQNRLLDLKAVLDEIEDAMEWPNKIAEAEKQLRDTNSIVHEHGNSNDRQTAATLEREARRAIESRDPDLLARKIVELARLEHQLLRQQPGFWVGFLQYLEDRRSTMRDQARADQLFALGQRAIQNDNVAQLQAAVQELLSLLPADQQAAATSRMQSTVI
jgi:molecular chaperone DnaK